MQENGTDFLQKKVFLQTGDCHSKKWENEKTGLFLEDITGATECKIIKALGSSLTKKRRDIVSGTDLETRQGRRRVDWSCTWGETEDLVGQKKGRI